MFCTYKSAAENRRGSNSIATPRSGDQQLGKYTMSPNQNSKNLKIKTDNELLIRVFIVKCLWNAFIIRRSMLTSLIAVCVISIQYSQEVIDIFQQKCLRKIFKIHWPMKITNAEVRTKTGSTRVSEQMKIRRRQWLGHVLRMEPDSLPRTAITWAPEGKRKRGRPKETWRRTVERDWREMEFETWREAEQVPKDRRRWRDLIKGPILQSGVRT